MLVDSTLSAVSLGQFGLVLDNLETLEVCAKGAPGGRARIVADLRRDVDAAIEGSEELRRWERYEADQSYVRLRPRFAGKTMHMCGGQVQDWAPELERELGLAGLRWHETEKDGSKNIDWAKNLGERDVVVIVTTNIGHSVSIPLRDLCTRRGVPCYSGSRRLRETLKALEAGA